MSDNSPVSQPTRRQFMMRVAGAAAAIPLVPHLANAAEAAPPPPAAPLPAGYESLGPDEAAFVEAMVNVMCPADALTPNGVDCGLAIFIDRQLAGGFGKGERLYTQGPWQPGKPQQGYQLPLTPEQFFKAGIARRKRRVPQAATARPSSNSTPRERDAFLQELAAGKVQRPAHCRSRSGSTSSSIRCSTQACFADPIYGGNRDKVFWKMVGYPGLPAFHTQDMVAVPRQAFPGAQQPQSIQDFS